MDHHLEAAVSGGGFEVRQDVHQIAVSLVVIPVNSPGAVSLAEFQQQGSEIVGQVAFLEARTAQGLANQDVKEERLGRKQHRTDGQQSFEQIGRIEQRIGSLSRQPPLQICTTVRGAAAQKQDHQLQVCRSQAAPRIRTDHDESSIN